MKMNMLFDAEDINNFIGVIRDKNQIKKQGRFGCR